jgi:hypothetical protein
LIDELGWKYVARIKSNRLLDGERFSKKWPHGFGQAQCHLKQVPEQVRIIKDGKRYWATNDPGLNPGQIKRVYRRRQQVEETLRLLKQEFGWGGSGVRKAKARTAICIWIDGAMFDTTSGPCSRADRLCIQARFISSTHPEPTPFFGALFSRCVISVYAQPQNRSYIYQRQQCVDGIGS